MVTEYYPGETIMKLIATNRMYGEKFVKRIIKQLIGALNYIHSMGYVHRDIKLENIINQN